ncbi:hypothetical protein Tco_1328389 [Tanacetum coccineum]
MTHLLEKETPFIFSKECIEAFETLKLKLTQAPILVAPDWDLPLKSCVMQVILLLGSSWGNETDIQEKDKDKIWPEFLKSIHYDK